MNTTETRSARVIVAMLTPCSKVGVPCPERLGRLASTLTARGCDGLFVVSSTGEMPLLGRAQRRELIAATKAAAGGTATIYAGVSGTGIAETVAFAEDAADAGADVAVAMAPFFLKLNQPELLAYFRQLADASPLPLALYHHLRMPSTLETATVRRLAEHPKIGAIKDTSGDAQRVVALADRDGGGRLAVYQGSEFLLFESLGLGARGFVTALANVAPEWHRDLIDAWDQGKQEEAQAAQEKITRLGQMFYFDAVGRSFTHFAYALRRAAQVRGWLDGTHGMVPGFVPDAEYDRQLDAHFAESGLCELGAGRESP